MELDTQVVSAVEAALGQHLGRELRLQDAKPLPGGSINDSWELATPHGRFFLKTNSADHHPSRFISEAQDLGLLRTANALRIPHVIAQGDAAGTTFLLLEFIAATAWTADADAALGRALAEQHRRTQAEFGLDRDNWIGTLPQVNTPKEEWIDFLVENRLDPMVRMAREQDRIAGGDVLRFEQLYTWLSGLLPPEPPALLHGDLWQGNVLSVADGVYAVDPAAYFGHREMDIAMAGLFGAIGPGFFRAYNEAWPLEPDWESRLGIYQLWPLLVHLNLFGGGYGAQISGILRDYD